jgi:hypothetical protein
VLLIVSGIFILYAVVHGKLAPSPSSSASSGSGGGGGGSGGSGGGGGQADSGSHSAIDLTGTATGTVGQVYTVSSTYGGATDQQKDDMNAYAHQVGNVSG